MKKTVLCMMLAILFTTTSFAVPPKKAPASPTTESTSYDSSSDSSLSDDEEEESSDSSDSPVQELTPALEQLSLVDSCDAIYEQLIEELIAEAIADEWEQEKNKTYERLQKVSRRFLAEEKDSFISPLARYRLHKFKEEYDRKKPSIINLTRLSSRSRIYLLRSLIQYKTANLPHEYEECSPILDHNAADFRSIEVRSNGWWKKSSRHRENTYFEDELPTTLKIGHFTYTITLRPTFRQKGNVLGRSLPYYANIDSALVQKHSSQLLQQKKEGRPRSIEGTKQEKHLLNGVNLLLDLEVARRLVDRDPYKDLPVITFIPHLVAHYENCSGEFIVGKDASKWGVTYHRYGNNPLPLISLFTNGEKTTDREHVAKQLILKLDRTYTQSSAAVRHGLKGLHQSDEDSGDESSGDEEEPVETLLRKKKRFLREYSQERRDESGIWQQLESELEGGEQDLETEQSAFLSDVVENYTTSMRNADPQQEEIMWGGDLELGAIATLANLRIVIHQPGIQEITINQEESEREIHLWFAGGHYQNYDPATNRRAYVPADGNCLFHAAIRASHTLNGDIPENPEEEVRLLRNQVADYLLEHQTDSIRERFAAVFEAAAREDEHGEDREADQALVDAVTALPPGGLLNRAIRLLPSRQSILATAVSFLGPYALYMMNPYSKK
jgi:hypothetical protein